LKKISQQQQKLNVGQCMIHIGTFQTNNTVYCNSVLTVVGFEGKRKKHPEVVSVVLVNCFYFLAVCKLFLFFSN
jgi:hypothetical protein